MASHVGVRCAYGGSSCHRLQRGRSFCQRRSSIRKQYTSAGNHLQGIRIDPVSWPLPANHKTILIDISIFPQKSGFHPQQSGFTTQQSGFYPQQSGISSHNPESIPSNPVSPNTIRILSPAIRYLLTQSGYSTGIPTSSPEGKGSTVRVHLTSFCMEFEITWLQVNDVRMIQIPSTCTSKPPHCSCSQNDFIYRNPDSITIWMEALL